MLCCQPIDHRVKFRDTEIVDAVLNPLSDIQLADNAIYANRVDTTSKELPNAFFVRQQVHADFNYYVAAKGNPRSTFRQCMLDLLPHSSYCVSS